MNIELKPGMNTGFLEQSPRETDFIAGSGELAADILVDSGDWTPYLPSGEAQIGVYFDTMACVTFSALNLLETLINRLLAEGQVPVAAKQRLKDLGYLSDAGRINLSDRFTAKMSGTTRRGNYLTNVWDSIKRDGVLPEIDWNYPREQRNPVFDWEDYYQDVPPVLKAKALEFKKIFDVDCEWLVTGGRATVEQYRTWLKTGPIQIATAICPPWNSDVIPACGLAVGHATLMHKADDVLHIYDHYQPFRKRFTTEYPIPYAMRGLVSVKNVLQANPLDPIFAKKLAGKMLLAVEDRGALWYVTPEGKRAKVGNTPAEVEAFLQAVRDKRVPVVGITNANLSKIQTV